MTDPAAAGLTALGIPLRPDAERSYRKKGRLR